MDKTPKYKTAIYTRLSIENSGKTDNHSVMATQIEYCKNYIATHETLELVGIYTDDGVSGTQFHRPELNRLFDDIKTGLVQAIVVRDFTRLSRDVIDMGYLMEKFFPLYNVRIIAIADGYDSATTQEMDTLHLKFHYILSDYYSRDLSVKVKSSVRNRMKRGTYLSGLTIYGYQKDAQKRMAIDTIVADHVRFIFNAYSTGMRIFDICKTLQEQQIPTPSAYRKGSDNADWSPHTVRKILNDERYTGTYVAGKTKKVKCRYPQKLLTPSTEWIVIKNHHTAIISHDTFQNAQNRKHPINSQKTTAELQSEKEQIPLWGKVYCGHCRRKMQRKGKKTFAYYCRYRNAHHFCPCNGNHLKEVALEKIVYTFLCEQAKQLTADPPQNDAPTVDRTVDISAPCQKEKQKQYLFEQFISGNLSELEYAKKKNMLDQKIESTLQTSPKNQRKSEFIDDINASTSLTKQLVTAYIDCIFVCGDDVEISMTSPLF